MAGVPTDDARDLAQALLVELGPGADPVTRERLDKIVNAGRARRWDQRGQNGGVAFELVEGSEATQCVVSGHGHRAPLTLGPDHMDALGDKAKAAAAEMRARLERRREAGR